MRDEIAAGVKAAPAVGGAFLSGLTLNDWVALVTLIYVVLQIGLLMPKYWAVIKRRLAIREPCE